jgi:hypothetical protein
MYKNVFQSILNSCFNTTKCGINQRVWILSEGTVTALGDSF